MDRIFRYLDTELTGNISLEQLKAINILNKSLIVPNDRLEKIMKAIDLDGTGKIDCAEFRGASLMIAISIDDIMIE